MFGFKARKMEEFYQKNKAFLNWYLIKKCNIPEKLHHFALQYFVDCLEEDILKLVFASEEQQCKWITTRMDEFAEMEKKRNK